MIPPSLVDVIRRIDHLAGIALHMTRVIYIFWSLMACTCDAVDRAFSFLRDELVMQFIDSLDLHYRRFRQSSLIGASSNR